ncbi:MAG: hypothetical protein NTX57_15240 [Armatimonadetes bacterium]|nr:hypothetical protein [Armatimonadota bacterium]
MLIVDAQGQPLTATQNPTGPEAATKPRPAMGVFLQTWGVKILTGGS